LIIVGVLSAGGVAAVTFNEDLDFIVGGILATLAGAAFRPTVLHR